MIELFCILSMLFIIGFFVSKAAKGAGRKISRLTAPNSRCSVTRTDDGEYYDLNYLGPNNHIEMAKLRMGSTRNHIASLDYDNKVFKFVIKRREFVPDRVLEEKTFEARTVKELAEDIEKQFKEWDTKDGSAYLWEYPYK